MVRGVWLQECFFQISLREQKKWVCGIRLTMKHRSIIPAFVLGVKKESLRILSFWTLLSLCDHYLYPLEEQALLFLPGGFCLFRFAFWIFVLNIFIDKISFQKLDTIHPYLAICSFVKKNLSVEEAKVAFQITREVSEGKMESVSVQRVAGLASRKL